MEPRIQYAKTADGVSIAFSVTGEGPPLVQVPGWVSHVELDWHIPMPRWFLDEYARYFRCIRLDKRGTGASQWNVQDHSLEAHVRDVEAVVDHLRLKRFALLGWSEGGQTAITYTVRHPRRVSRLVLDRSFARGTGLGEGRGELLRAVTAVVRAEWGTGSKVLSDFFCGEDADPMVTRSFAQYTRAAATPEDAYLLMKATLSSDVTPALARVRAPTLVLAARDDQIVPIELAKEMAAGIPGARFVSVAGAHATTTPQQAAERASAVVSFLLEKEQSPFHSSDRSEASASALRTVLFTDLVRHTEMMSRLGDQRGRGVLREHERITREVLRAHGGTEVKTMGDGFLASFGSVTKAVECAVALQRAIGNWQSEIGNGERIEVRCGLNAGEPIEEDGDLFGATVILASRIAAKADGGEILVADTVRGLCSGKGFLFADRGEFVAKEFEEPARVYEVRWRV